MTLKTFQEIYENKPVDVKLEKLFDLTETIAADRKNACDASWNQNEQVFKYWQETENEMWQRMKWLIQNVKEYIFDLECKAEAAEEYLMESEEYENFEGDDNE